MEPHRSASARRAAARVFAAAALATAFVSSAACRSVPSASEESYVQIADGTLLHYQRYGDGADVLLVPGASSVAADLSFLADGRSVIFYDARGRGRSDRAASLRLARDLEDLEAVRSWFGLERFELLGTDYYAALGAHYAAENPKRVTRLVMVSPIPVAKFPHWEIYRRTFDDRSEEAAFRKLAIEKRQGRDREDPEGFALDYRDALYGAWVVDDSSLRRMRSNPFVAPNQGPEVAVRAYLSLLRDLGDWDWRQEMSAIACPTMIVHGDGDPMPPASFEDWRAAIPGARSVVVERSGHMPWLERPGPFREAVRGFLGD